MFRFLHKYFGPKPVSVHADGDTWTAGERVADMPFFRPTRKSGDKVIPGRLARVRRLKKDWATADAELEAECDYDD